MASPNPSRRPKGVLQQSIKEIQTRMGALEARVDRVEYQVEIADAYRHLRLERCPEADAVWARFENKTLPPNELRTAMSTAVETAVKQALGQQVDEALFQNKASELSVGKRGVPVQAVRAALSAQFSSGFTKVVPEVWTGSQTW